VTVYTSPCHTGIAEAVGESIEAANAKRADAVFGDNGVPAQDSAPGDAPIPRMYIEFDGTGVPMTGRELKGRRGKQAGRQHIQDSGGQARVHIHAKRC
jgi:hypothetical protein